MHVFPTAASPTAIHLIVLNSLDNISCTAAYLKCSEVFTRLHFTSNSVEIYDLFVVILNTEQDSINQSQSTQFRADPFKPGSTNCKPSNSDCQIFQLRLLYLTNQITIPPIQYCQT